MTSTRPTGSEPRAGNEEQFLLVTGCYRSGTTLCEKLIHAHPSACVASQPFPIFYFRVKEAFLRSRDLRRRYPLDHLFLEDGYHPEDFFRFLKGYRLTTETIATIFSELRDYELGLWTPEVLGLRDNVTPGLFVDVFRNLHRELPALLKRPRTTLLGSKEIICEEYAPFLSAHDVRTIIVLRDPRDMITSLDYRQRDNKTGAHRPLLYSLRLWRKSVAFALALEDDPCVLWLRYEDLVADPRGQLARVTDFLGIDSYGDEALDRRIRGQDGAAWTGNSSFDDYQGVSTASVGRHASVLPDRVVELIEGLCAFEMTRLGYALQGAGALNRDMLTEHRESFEDLHAKFPTDYGSAPERADQEIQRRAYLETGELKKDEQAAAARWFIRAEAYSKLLKAGAGR